MNEANTNVKRSTAQRNAFVEIVRANLGIMIVIVFIGLILSFLSPVFPESQQPTNGSAPDFDQYLHRVGNDFSHDSRRNRPLGRLDCRHVWHADRWFYGAKPPADVACGRRLGLRWEQPSDSSTA